MGKLCPYCKEEHGENDLCIIYKEELRNNPGLLSQAAEFTSVAGQYHLETSQTLAHIIPGFEGSHQVTGDTQKVKRLLEESYRRSSPNPEALKQYLEKATSKQQVNFSAKTSGVNEEVDWLRKKQGEIPSLWEKSRLYNGNAPGVDGETVNRFTDDPISRTTIKSAQSSRGLHTNAKGIIKSLEKGTLDPHDTVYGVKGIKNTLLKQLDKEIENASRAGNTELAKKFTEAKDNLIIKESNTMSDVKESVNRLKDKITAGNASTAITASHVAKQAAKGAVIGAAIGLTVSSITSYLRYRKGEITREEAFTEIGEDTVKSALSGGALAGLTLFLPAGAIGFIAGMAIGIYINAALTNVLDEIFGKGAYREILIADGHIVRTSRILVEGLQTFKQDRETTRAAMTRIRDKSQYTNELINIFDNNGYNNKS